MTLKTIFIFISYVFIYLALYVYINVLVFVHCLRMCISFNFKIREWILFSHSAVLSHILRSKLKGLKTTLCRKCTSDQRILLAVFRLYSLAWLLGIYHKESKVLSYLMQPSVPKGSSFCANACLDNTKRHLKVNEQQQVVWCIFIRTVNSFEGNLSSELPKARSLMWGWAIFFFFSFWKEMYKSSFVNSNSCQVNIFCFHISNGIRNGVTLLMQYKMQGSNIGFMSEITTCHSCNSSSEIMYFVIIFVLRLPYSPSSRTGLSV
jgi:hypothetical protein